MSASTIGCNNPCCIKAQKACQDANPQALVTQSTSRAACGVHYGCSDNSARLREMMACAIVSNDLQTPQLAQTHGGPPAHMQPSSDSSLQVSAASADSIPKVNATSSLQANWPLSQKQQNYNAHNTVDSNTQPLQLSLPSGVVRLRCLAFSVYAQGNQIAANNNIEPMQYWYKHPSASPNSFLLSNLHGRQFMVHNSINGQVGMLAPSGVDGSNGNHIWVAVAWPANHAYYGYNIIYNSGQSLFNYYVLDSANKSVNNDPLLLKTIQTTPYPLSQQWAIDPVDTSLMSAALLTQLLFARFGTIGLDFKPPQPTYTVSDVFYNPIALAQVNAVWNQHMGPGPLNVSPIYDQEDISNELMVHVVEWWFTQPLVNRGVAVGIVYYHKVINGIDTPFVHNIFLDGLWQLHIFDPVHGTPVDTANISVKRVII